MTPPKPIADVHTCHATCPCQPSKLGPLEFRPEDFQGTDLYLQDNMFLDAFVEIANRILTEKLEKAWTFYGNDLAAKGIDCWHSVQEPDDTHRARLVCICPITDKLEGK